MRPQYIFAFGVWVCFQQFLTTHFFKWTFCRNKCYQLIISALAYLQFSFSIAIHSSWIRKPFPSVSKSRKRWLQKSWNEKKNHSKAFYSRLGSLHDWEITTNKPFLFLSVLIVSGPTIIYYDSKSKTGFFSLIFAKQANFKPKLKNSAIFCNFEAKNSFFPSKYSYFAF